MSLRGIVKGTFNRGLKKAGILPEEVTNLGELRLSICKGCSLFNAANKKCTSCGCYMKTKVLNQQAKCPENKW